MQQTLTSYPVYFKSTARPGRRSRRTFYRVEGPAQVTWVTGRWTPESGRHEMHKIDNSLAIALPEQGLATHMKEATTPAGTPKYAPATERAFDQMVRSVLTREVVYLNDTTETTESDRTDDATLRRD